MLDASAFQVALLGTVEFLPFLLFTLPAGVWVDRLRRRPILVIADLGRAAALVSVPIAYAFDALTIWQLYVVGFVVGTLTVFFDVAYQSYLPSLVRRNQLVEGNSKLELSVSAAQLGGPRRRRARLAAHSALGRADGCNQLPRLRALRAPHPPAGGGRTADRWGRAKGMRAEAWEGLQFVWKDRRLRALTERTVIFNFCANGAFAVYLVYAVRSLGLSPAAIGVIFSIGNVGWLAGALVAGRLTTRLGVGRTIILTGAVAAPALMLVPAAPQSAPIPFLIAAGVLSSFGLVIWRIAQVSLRQAITPDHMLGRVNAVSRFMMWGTIRWEHFSAALLGRRSACAPRSGSGRSARRSRSCPCCSLLSGRSSPSRTFPTSRQTQCWSPLSASLPSGWTSRVRSLWPHRGLWRHPDFLKLWSAQTISLLGTQISQLAIPLAAILVLDASAFEVAAVGVAEFLPFLLFALPAGVWVDRLRRRPILVIADVGRGLALATIPLFYAFDALTIWQLYVVGFLVGTLTVFFDVAYQSYLPSLVSESSSSTATRSSRSAAQPRRSQGRELAAYSSRDHGAVRHPRRRHQLLRLRRLHLRNPREEPSPERAEERSMRRELVEGLRYLLGHRYWRPIATASPCRTDSDPSADRSSSSTPYASSTCPPLS